MHLWRHALERHLKEALGDTLQLVWTHNRRVMISFKRVRGASVLRLHESFATADHRTRDDLIYFIRHGRKVPGSVREFVRRISGELASAKETIRTKGRRYDLRKLYLKLNREYFGGKLSGKITWGKRAFAGQKRSIVFGSYLTERRLIRIHPVLDTEIVPRFYIESVVHHEMVHELLDTVEQAGREKGRVHPPRFRELERKFRYYELASAWEKNHLRKILRYRPYLKK